LNLNVVCMQHFCSCDKSEIVWDYWYKVPWASLITSSCKAGFVTFEWAVDISSAWLLTLTQNMTGSTRICSLSHKKIACLTKCKACFTLKSHSTEFIYTKRERKKLLFMLLFLLIYAWNWLIGFLFTLNIHKAFGCLC
jgi:hypothetical protein